MLPAPVVVARNIKSAAVASYELQLSMILPFGNRFEGEKIAFFLTLIVYRHLNKMRFIWLFAFSLGGNSI